MLREVRYSLRSLRRAPAATFVAVTSTAIAVGLSTAAFNLANVALLRPLHILDPSSIVGLERHDGRGRSTPYFSYPAYRELEARQDGLADLAAFGYTTAAIGTETSTWRDLVALVSGNYFEMLGVRPEIGRAFLEEENRAAGAHPVAVLSHRLWRERFSGNAAPLGASIALNGRSFTIVGVAPPGFTGTHVGFEPALWVPTMMQAQLVLPPLAVRRATGSNDLLSVRGSSWVFLLGRLAPHASRAAAAALLNAGEEGGQGSMRRIELIDVREARLLPQFRGFVNRGLLLLFCATAIVMAITCVNVAGLVLLRTAARARETAIRLAIGASRARVIWHLTVEGLLLALAGGLVGILLAAWAAAALPAALPPTPIPVQIATGVDPLVLGFGLLVSLCCGLGYGVAGAFYGANRDIVSRLRGGTITRARRGGMAGRLGRLGVGVQIALAIVLLVWSSLLVRSTRSALGIDLGFDRDVLFTYFNFELENVSDPAAGAFYGELLRSVREMPGVRHAALARTVPLAALARGTLLDYDPRAASSPSVQIGYNIVSPAYFATMAVPILKGRDFEVGDGPVAPKVAIVNEALERTGVRLGLWPDGGAIGKVYEGAEVIGVVRDARQQQLWDPAAPTVYLPLEQSFVRSLALVIKPGGDRAAIASALRAETRRLNPTVAAPELRSLAENVDLALWQPRMLTGLIASHALVATILMLIGVYGVVANSLRRRMKEFAVRMALGASRAQIGRHVVGTQLGLVVFWIAIGLGVAVASRRLLASFLFGVSSGDLESYVAAAIAVSAGVGLAIARPLLQCMRLSPRQWLNDE